MKYNVGYLGNCAELEEKLIEYCSLPENVKINCINLNTTNQKTIEAIAFNGLIFDTSLHDNENSDSLISSIISENPEIDVMPVITTVEKNSEFNSLDEREQEVERLKTKHGVSCIPYLIDSAREASLFINTIFSTLSTKTIRNIEKIEQYQAETRESMLKTLKKVVITLELKDPYTKDHSLRVSNYAKQIAFKMGLDENEVEEITEAGWLHDIGKLAINDDVLMKPSSLDDKEYFHMKSHSKIGAMLLKNIFTNSEGKNITKCTEHHHERYDGRGYPSNLIGEDIPLGARILCVADSFDAMTTQRSYNRPKKLEDAILDLTQNSGKQFDPQIAEIFIDLLKQEPSKLKETLGITIDNDGYIRVEHGPNIESILNKQNNTDEIKQEDEQSPEIN